MDNDEMSQLETLVFILYGILFTITVLWLIDMSNDTQLDESVTFRTLKPIERQMERLESRMERNVERFDERLERNSQRFNERLKSCNIRNH